MTFAAEQIGSIAQGHWVYQVSAEYQQSSEAGEFNPQVVWK